MKTACFALFFIFTCLLISPCLQSEATADDNEEIRIRDWQFIWTVEESGEAAFLVVKTDEAVFCVLRSGGVMSNQIRLQPDECVSLAALLEESGDRITALRRQIGDDEDTSETAESGDYRVRFYYSKDHGGTISLSEDGSFSSLRLETRQAEDLAEAMAHAVEYCEAVDERVNP